MKIIEHYPVQLIGFNLMQHVIKYMYKLIVIAQDSRGKVVI